MAAFGYLPHIFHKRSSRPEELFQCVRSPGHAGTQNVCRGKHLAKDKLWFWERQQNITYFQVYSCIVWHVIAYSTLLPHWSTWLSYCSTRAADDTRLLPDAMRATAEFSHAGRTAPEPCFSLRSESHALPCSLSKRLWLQVKHVSTKKWRRCLVNVKDKLPKGTNSQALSTASHAHCGWSYVGKTGNFPHRRNKNLSLNASDQRAEATWHERVWDNAKVMEKEELDFSTSRISD